MKEQAEEVKEGQILPARKESDEEFLKRIREDFKVTADFESEERVKMLDDLRFVRLGGEYQWPDYARKNRMTPGAERPMLTDNRVKQYRTSVINQIRQNMPAIKVRPVDDQADIKTAEILQGVIRNIEALSKADNAKDKAIEFAVDCGRGFFGLMTQYVTDDSWDQEIAFRIIPDPFKVYLDPYSVEPDGSDARFGFLVEDMPRTQFEREYPDVDLTDWDEGAAGDVDGWMSEETVRIAEHYEVVETPMELVLLQDGRTLWADEVEEMAQQALNMAPVQATRKSVRKRCVWSKICGNQRTETRELPTQYVPLIPVYGEEFWDEGRHYMQGLVRNAKDPQRLYNFWLSSVAEQVALQPKVPFIAPEGTFEGHETEWAAANSKNFAYLEYTPVTLGGQVLAGPSRQPPPPIPTGYVEQMNTALEGIKAAVGMQNPAIGAPETANQSGRAIRSLQQQAAIGTAHFGDNLAKSVEHAGRIIIEMIPKIYDTRRVMRILGEDGAADHAVHDPNAPAAMQKQQNPMTGEITTIYNLGVGRYDVQVSAGPSYGTKRQEGFDALTQMVQSMPQLGQVAGDLIIRLSDSPYADEMADRLKAILPPPVQAIANNTDGQAPDPQLMAAQQQIQQMGQQMQQMGQELQKLQAEQGSKQQEVQMKSMELQAQQEQKAAELQIKQMELQAKQEDLQLRLFEAQTKRLEIVGANDEENAVKEQQEMEMEAQEMQVMAGVAESLAVLNQQIQAHRDAVEGLKNQHEAAHQFAMDRIGEVLRTAQPTVGIKAMRDASGKLIGGIQQKADGSEIPVRIQ